MHKNMRKKLHCPVLLAAVVVFNCGFTWGFGHSDPCEKASKLAQGFSAAATKKEKENIEKTVVKLCPDGAGTHFINALREESAGKGDKAVAEYRKTVQLDDRFSEAHGNLGLLLFGQHAQGEASVELSKALPGKPDPRYHKALGLILAEARVYPLGLFHLQEASKGLPGDVVVMAGIAECRKRLGAYELSEKEYRRILEAEPRNIPARLGLAEVLIYRKKREEAGRQLQSIFAEDAGNIEAHRLMGEIRQSEGDLEAARREFLKAGIRYNVDPKEYLRQADAMMASGEYDKAVAAYEVVLGSGTAFPGVLEKLGSAQMATGRTDDAIASFLRALLGNSRHSETHYNLGVLYERKGRLDEAVKSYLNCVRLDPGNGDARRRLADIYTLQGSFALAVEAYSDLIRLNPTNPLIHMKLAKTYERQKNYRQAIESYREAVKLAPDNLQARRELAVLYAKRGMASEAADQYREILRQKKNEKDARNALVAIYVRNRSYEPLLRVLQEGAEIFPNDPDAHYKLGIFLEFRKEPDAAIAQYQEAIKLKADHAKALNALGRVYLRTGDLERAKQMLEAAKKADPQLSEPQEMLADIREDLSPLTPVKEIRAKKGVRSGKSHGIKRSRMKKTAKAIRGGHTKKSRKAGAGSKTRTRRH